MAQSVTINFLFIFLFFCTSFSQSPKHEVRAVWLSSASGDWPKTINKAEQQRSLVEIFDLLKNNNFNTVFFQVRFRGSTFYNSEIEPWAQQLTGVLGKDPEWDPLQFAIDEAHKRGMEVHAWFNVAKVWGLGDSPVHPKHILKTHPGWVKQVEGEWWLDMGITEAREYTVNVAGELVSKYDLDGIQFDFVRYPNEAFDDWDSFIRQGDGVERNEWRRNNITSFVRDCYKKFSAIKPRLKIGSAPLGIYQPINGAQSSFTGYSGVFQDSRLWLKEGIHDYLVPQLYWTIGEQQNPNDPDFAALCNDWIRENFGRHIYAGIGIYRDNVRQETRTQAEISRNALMQGQSYFRYEQLRMVLPQLGSVYGSPALIPPMKWKDSIPPLPPLNITMDPDKENVITWEEPPEAGDGEKPFRYAIYRSEFEPVDTKKAENLLAVVPSSQLSFVDNFSEISGNRFYYTVTSLDRLWNESGSDTLSAEELSLFSRYEKSSSRPLLSQNYPNPFSTITYISFEIPERSKVVLSLTFGESRKDTVVVSGIKNAGMYVVTIDGTTFPSGEIEYYLVAGESTLKGVMLKK